VYYLAPSAPVKVIVASNGTDAVTVQWSSPEKVFHRVDRYYVLYQDINERQSHEMTIDDVNDSHDVHEVGSFFTPHVF